MDMGDSISLFGGERPMDNGGSYTARDNQNRMSLPLYSSRLPGTDNFYQT
jgi:hypothetical protein